MNLVRFLPLPPVPWPYSLFWSLFFRDQGDNRGWDGWMASLTQWTWVWASSGRWWRTGKPGMLQSMGLQRFGHNWATKKQQQLLLLLLLLRSLQILFLNSISEPLIMKPEITFSFSSYLFPKLLYWKMLYWHLCLVKVFFRDFQCFLISSGGKTILFLDP